MTCPICWENMDMKEFNDSRESTTTCFKLECNHSYHTKCIVMFLTKTKSECPICNKIKTPSIELDLQGYSIKLIKEIIREPSIKIIKNELEESKYEYQQSLIELKKNTRKFVEEQTKNLKVKEKRDYYLKCLNTIKSIIRKQCYLKGNKYIAAISFQKRYWETSVVEMVLFKQKYAYPWKLRKLLYPRINFPIRFLLNIKNNESNNSNSDGDDNSSVYSLF